MFRLINPHKMELLLYIIGYVLLATIILLVAVEMRFYFDIRKKRRGFMLRKGLRREENKIPSYSRGFGL